MTFGVFVSCTYLSQSSYWSHVDHQEALSDWRCFHLTEESVQVFIFNIISGHRLLLVGFGGFWEIHFKDFCLCYKTMTVMGIFFVALTAKYNISLQTQCPCFIFHAVSITIKTPFTSIVLGWQQKFTQSKPKLSAWLDTSRVYICIYTIIINKNNSLFYLSFCCSLNSSLSTGKTSHWKLAFVLYRGEQLGGPTNISWSLHWL